MTTTLIAEHKIPGSEQTVRIEHRDAYGDRKALYIITREGDLGHGFNYLSAGRPTEAEAREVANFLWVDARDRAAAMAAPAATPLFVQPWQPIELPAHDKAPAARGPRQPVTEAGMYRDSDGVIYKVQRAVHGSGNLYAKHLVQRDGDGSAWKFEYLPGGLRQLDARDRLTLAEAQEFGQLYGVCCCCGAVLTDETSIENGIGPVCASKL